MKYQYRSRSGAVFEIEASIHDGPPSLVRHPETGEEAQRIYGSIPDIWHTDGSHRHDYNATGDKLDQLNRSWSKHFGEDPPPKSSEVKRNSGEIQ